MNTNLKQTSHVLHLIATVVFFPWVIAWVVCTLSNNSHNRTVMLMHAMQPAQAAPATSQLRKIKGPYEQFFNSLAIGAVIVFAIAVLAKIAA